VFDFSLERIYRAGLKKLSSVKPDLTIFKVRIRFSSLNEP
jgi:hypothetical protein